MGTILYRLFTTPLEVRSKIDKQSLDWGFLSWLESLAGHSRTGSCNATRLAIFFWVNVWVKPCGWFPETWANETLDRRPETNPHSPIIQSFWLVLSSCPQPSWSQKTIPARPKPTKRAEPTKSAADRQLGSEPPVLVSFSCGLSLARSYGEWFVWGGGWVGVIRKTSKTLVFETSLWTWNSKSSEVLGGSMKISRNHWVLGISWLTTSYPRLAGIAVDVPLHPLDTLKTRVQSREGTLGHAE